MSDTLSSFNGNVTMIYFSGLDLIFMVTSHSHRCRWYRKFRTYLGSCRTIEDLDDLLRVKVTGWRGRSHLLEDDEAGEQEQDPLWQE
jgi:hypothetical protein